MDQLPTRRASGVGDVHRDLVHRHPTGDGRALTVHQHRCATGRLARVAVGVAHAMTAIRSLRFAV